MTTTETVTSWAPAPDTFAIRLAMVRNRLGWNSKEAALACGLPQASWREWETFDRLPRDLPRVAEQIAARTGVDDYWLMTGKTSGPRPTSPPAEGPNTVRHQGLEPRTRWLTVAAVAA